MDPITRGWTSLVVSRLGLGGTPIGRHYGRPISKEGAVATIHRALGNGITFVDTAPAYGRGQSEQSIGRALATYPAQRPIMATKVGRISNELWSALDA